MKRQNTASKEMIEDFAELKKQGIKHFLVTTTTDTKTYTPVVKSTAQGVSSYANKMFRKYGDDTKVEVGYFDSNCNYNTYCTYG